MSPSIDVKASVFARKYAALFSSPDACNPDKVAGLAKEVSKHYRPRMTMFTNGKVERFESQDQAAQLIETEMRNNITTGLGTKLVLERIEKVEVYSDTSALCWLLWSFHPMEESEFEGKTWSFTNVYSYRAESQGLAEGWESVLRDHEVNEFVRATGRSFEG